MRFTAAISTYNLVRHSSGGVTTNNNNKNIHPVYLTPNHDLLLQLISADLCALANYTKNNNSLMRLFH